MIEKNINLGHGNIYYWISHDYDPNKMTLFFLHGLLANHNMFQEQISHFKGSYNIITWDAPLHGDSRDYTNFSFDHAVEEMKSILDVNGVDKVVLIGQSLGGYFAQSFLDIYTQRTIAFIGIDTTPYGLEYYSRFDNFLLRQVGWMSRLYPLNFLKISISKSVSFKQETQDSMYSMMERYNKEDISNTMDIYYKAFLKDNRDIEIKCPTLLILGEYDKTGKVKKYNNIWHKRIGHPLKIVEKASHNSNIDNPEAVNREIEEFLLTLF